MTKRALLAALLCVACRKAAPAPEVALTPEQTLADIFQRYPDTAFNDSEHTDPIPLAADPWAHKVVRVAGRVHGVEATRKPLVELEAPTSNKRSTLSCELPEGTRPLALGSVATLEGKLYVSRHSLPGPGGPIPSGASRVSFVLDSCRVIQGTPRTFGTTAGALGLTPMPLEKLLSSSPKLGTRVAFTARAIESKGWSVVSENQAVPCLGPGMNHKDLHRFDYSVAIVARVAAAPAGGSAPIQFEDCQPIDE